MEQRRRWIEIREGHVTKALIVLLCLIHIGLMQVVPCLDMEAWDLTFSIYGGAQKPNWFRHNATSREVAGSIPHEVIECFQYVSAYYITCLISLLYLWCRYTERINAGFTWAGMVYLYQYSLKLLITNQELYKWRYSDLVMIIRSSFCAYTIDN
jgi:hypothetical protein